MQLLEKPQKTNSKDTGATSTKPKYLRIRTPTLLQMEAVECGAAALGIILAYYKRIVPLTELRSSCGVSRDGSKASNILKAARYYNLQAKGLKKDTTQLREFKPPFIVFWNFNHFLVVEGFVGDRVWLNDPATGPRSVLLEEFNEAYTGVALLMEPGKDFRKGGRKPSIIAALYERLKGSFIELLYCILAGFLLVIPELAIAAASQVFIDEILISNRLHWTRPLLTGMVVAALIQLALTYFQLRKLRYLNVRLSTGMTSRFLRHILNLPIGFYAQRFSGEISSRLTINSQVAQILSGQLTRTVIDAVMALVYGLVMFAYDPILTLIGIIAVTINIVVLQWLSRQRTDLNIRLSQDFGKIAGIEIGGLQSIETLKSAALEADFFARWAGYYAKATNAQQELGNADQILGLLPVFLTALTSMFLLAVGGLRVMDGHLTIGMLIAFQTLMANFQGPVNTLVGMAGTIQTLEGNLNRLDDVLGCPVDESVKLSDQTTALQYATPTVLENNCKLQGYVELRNITFGYSKADEPLIRDFSCRLQPGQRVAFVGGSGSGKSTLSKLVTGLYQPWNGEILLDGVPRNQIPRSILTNSLSIVEQDVFLFGGSVRENLTLWDDTIADEQMIKACQDAAILDVIKAVPGGLNGQLLEGAANLSGGQRQRLEIARALVNDPTILVMDEATSALDAETERIVDRNIRRRGCSCIIVAHRLSTIRDCDEIIVLERGQVVQRGTHDEMKQIDGAYARLIQAE
jgi:NHLM bacteriocin system ABC transporter peptidase/ATP-binding protein